MLFDACSLGKSFKVCIPTFFCTISLGEERVGVEVDTDKRTPGRDLFTREGLVRAWILEYIQLKRLQSESI